VARTVYICGFSIWCCWKPFISEKERLNAAGAAISPCGELVYICACGGDPAGKDEDNDVRATCIVAAQRRAGGGGGSE
jgi:hypothetical protein